MKNRIAPFMLAVSLCALGGVFAKTAMATTVHYHSLPVCTTTLPLPPANPALCNSTCVIAGAHLRCVEVNYMGQPAAHCSHDNN